ncbi:MAG: O-antigen ligase family protein [Candidatus Omnitrophota bacterium]|nr:O-antigen ligase family protein [Candidatus Omnitrophota bacterium]
MDKHNIHNLNKKINYLGITLLGLFSLGYCIFENLFAEINIQLNFLDFPIFIGEILFFFCLILLLIKWAINKEKNVFFNYVIFIYFLFVLVKAYGGYLVWGPLALRHSALFYYPLFAVFGYSFFRLDYFRDKRKLALVLILLFISIIFTINSSYKFICFILAFVLIKTFPKGLLKYLFLFLFVAFVPYKDFLSGKRTMWISNIVSGIFLIVTLNFIFKIKRSHRLVLYGILCLFFSIGLIKFADKNALSTIINLKENFSRFKVLNDMILAQKENFIMSNLGKPRLYNKGIETEPHIYTELSKESPAKPILEQSLQKQQDETHEFLQPTLLQPTTPIEQKTKNLGKLDTSYLNNSFRIFIWQDLLEALITEKPIFGFDFGKPFRSKSIEILNIAHGEWTRDGWIAVHNSYLEMIYRAGIIGILLVVTTFVILFKMIMISIKLKLINGVLLCAVLINWIISASFMPVLELPYKAIPFWICFGMTLCYLKNYKKIASR